MTSHGQDLDHMTRLNITSSPSISPHLPSWGTAFYRRQATFAAKKTSAQLDHNAKRINPQKICLIMMPTISKKLPAFIISSYENRWHSTNGRRPSKQNCQNGTDSILPRLWRRTKFLMMIKILLAPTWHKKLKLDGLFRARIFPWVTRTRMRTISVVRYHYWASKYFASSFPYEMRSDGFLKRWLLNTFITRTEIWRPKSSNPRQITCKGSSWNCEYRSGIHVSECGLWNFVHRSYVINCHVISRLYGCQKALRRKLSSPLRIPNSFNMSTSWVRRAVFRCPQSYLINARLRLQYLSCWYGNFKKD